MSGATIATLAVATGTFLLAWATFRLGSRAAEETRAQWRPVLLIRARRFPEDRKVTVRSRSTSVDIENVGRGPALDVMVMTADGAIESRVSAIAPGETSTIHVASSNERDGALVFKLAYNDLSAAGFATSVMIRTDSPDTEPKVLFQFFETYGTINFWWHSIIPRPVRPRFWPLTKRLLRRRGYRIP